MVQSITLRTEAEMSSLRCEPVICFSKYLQSVQREEKRHNNGYELLSSFHRYLLERNIAS